jgi:hypothetical protein
MRGGISVASGRYELGLRWEARENPVDQDSLDAVWNGLMLCLERQGRESTLSSVNLWHSKRMGAPVTDDPPAPPPTGAHCCMAATISTDAEEAVDHCRL